MGWLHEHKHMGQGRPPDDALQASLVSAADPQAAGDHARLGLIRRALDQGQEVRSRAKQGWPAVMLASGLHGVRVVWASAASAATAVCTCTTLAFSACGECADVSPGRCAASTQP